MIVCCLGGRIASKKAAPAGFTEGVFLYREVMAVYFLFTGVKLDEFILDDFLSVREYAKKVCWGVGRELPVSVISAKFGVERFEFFGKAVACFVVFKL